MWGGIPTDAGSGNAAGGETAAAVAMPVVDVRWIPAAIFGDETAATLDAQSVQHPPYLVAACDACVVLFAVPLPATTLAPDSVDDRLTHADTPVGEAPPRAPPRSAPSRRLPVGGGGPSRRPHHRLHSPAVATPLAHSLPQTPQHRAVHRLPPEPAVLLRGLAAAHSGVFADDAEPGQAVAARREMDLVADGTSRRRPRAVRQLRPAVVLVRFGRGRAAVPQHAQLRPGRAGGGRSRRVAAVRVCRRFREGARVSRHRLRPSGPGSVTRAAVHDARPPTGGWFGRVQRGLSSAVAVALLGRCRRPVRVVGRARVKAGMGVPIKEERGEGAKRPRSSSPVALSIQKFAHALLSAVFSACRLRPRRSRHAPALPPRA
eukprot:ctg_208.g133